MPRFSLLQRRADFRRLWLSNVISNLGSWLSYIAVSVLVLERGGGAFSLAVVFAIHCLPLALLAPVAGPLVDRLDRRKVMLWAHVIRAGLTFAMAGAAALAEVEVLQALLLLRVMAGAFFYPAERAALPRVVPQEELVDANALDSLTWSVLFTAGVALGGLLTGWVGPTLAIFLDAFTFLLAAAALWRLPSLCPLGASLPRSTSPSQLAGELVESWCFARARGKIWRAIFAKVPLAFAGGGAWVTLNLVSMEFALLGAATALGILQAARGLGMGMGPLLSFQLKRRARIQPDGGFELMTFGALAVFLSTGSLLFMLVAVFCWGMGIGQNWVSSTSALQGEAPDVFMGRLSALDVLLATGAQAVAALLGGGLVEWTGAAADAGWLALAGGLSLWLWGRFSFLPRGGPRWAMAQTMV